MKNVLIIVGSLRKNSFNRQLAQALEAMLEDKANISYLECGDIPYLNQDMESVPESVAKARAAVLESDGILMLSPEYNNNIPGVLKNLLDWLSCPIDPSDRKSPSALKGKAVSIFSAAGRSAGVGMRKNLAQLLEIMSMRLVGGEGYGVVLGAEAFSKNILSLSGEDYSELRKLLDEFISNI